MVIVSAFHENVFEEDPLLKSGLSSDIFRASTFIHYL